MRGAGENAFLFCGDVRGLGGVGVASGVPEKAPLLPQLVHEDHTRRGLHHCMPRLSVCISSPVEGGCLDEKDLLL